MSSTAHLFNPFLGALATSALIIIVVTVAAVALLVALERRAPRHRHTWRDVGTTAVGWTLMRCHCGDIEIR